MGHHLNPRTKSRLISWKLHLTSETKISKLSKRKKFQTLLDPRHKATSQGILKKSKNPMTTLHSRIRTSRQFRFAVIPKPLFTKIYFALGILPSMKSSILQSFQLIKIKASLKSRFMIFIKTQCSRNRKKTRKTRRHLQ